jgi:hypothetical protein
MALYRYPAVTLEWFVPIAIGWFGPNPDSYRDVGKNNLSPA